MFSLYDGAMKILAAPGVYLAVLLFGRHSLGRLRHCKDDSLGASKRLKGSGRTWLLAGSSLAFLLIGPHWLWIG